MSNTNHNNNHNSDSPFLLFNSHTCANCGKSAATSGNNNSNLNRLYLCQGCEKVGYCSKSCQKADWRRGHHRELCLHVLQAYPVHSNRIRAFSFYESRALHADSVLEYAGNHMAVGAHLQHVTLHLTPLSPITGEHCLTSHQLTSFLERTGPHLLTLALSFDKDTVPKRRAVQSLTDHGKAFLPLANCTRLQKLELEHASFNDVKDLCRSLPPNLQALALDSLELGYSNQHLASTSSSSTLTNNNNHTAPWPKTAARTLAHVVSQRLRTTLQSLSLRNSYLVDADVHPFLSGLRRLTRLVLCSTNQQQQQQDCSMEGGLTDAGLAVIASYYDTTMASNNNIDEKFGLQSLDLSGHTRATLAGVQTLLRACGDTLRELHVAGLALHSNTNNNNSTAWDASTTTIMPVPPPLLVVLGLDERQWNHRPLQQWVRASRGRLGCLVDTVGWTDYSELLLLVNDNNNDDNIDDDDDNDDNDNATQNASNEYGDAETVHATLEAQWELWRTVHERLCDHEFVNGSEWDGL